MKIHSPIVTGSLSVSPSLIVTGSIQGTASFASTASVAILANSSSYPFSVTGSTIYTTALGSLTNVDKDSSVFIGYNAGAGTVADNARKTTSVGYESVSGSVAIDAISIGYRAGAISFITDGAVTIGRESGYSSSFFQGSTAVGSYSGYGATSGYGIFLGYGSGYNMSPSPANFYSNYFSTFIGYYAGSGAVSTGYHSIMLGSYTGEDSKYIDNSIFIGQNAGASAISSSYAIFFGKSSGGSAKKINNSIFIGYYSGQLSNSASYSNFIGYATAYQASSSYSTLIGTGVGRTISGTGIGDNNIIIGKNITLENGRRDSINLGGIIFATGSYAIGASDYFSQPAFSGSANGRVGINVVNPQYTLDVSGSGNYTNGLTVTGSTNLVNLTGSSALFTGAITAQTLVVQQVTSSIVYSSGSNIFGNQLTDVQQMTGSLRVTGSGDHYIVGGNVGIGAAPGAYKLDVNGNGRFTNGLTVTGSLITSGSSTFINIGPASFTGSVSVTGGGFTGSLKGNVDGNAATVTNGVYTNGSYADPSWITSLAGSKISGNISGNAANITAYTINQNLSTTSSPTFSTVTAALTGNASTATVVNGSSGQNTTKDDRIIEPNSITSGRMQFGFTSWANNNGAPYADYLHLRSYTDSSGGKDNLVMFNKDVIGMRIWQQAWDSSAAYSSYKDVAWTDGTNATGTWGISISGNAATVSNGVYTTGDQTIGGNKTFSGITTFSNSGDAQINLVSPDTWAGIQFDDSNSSPDYIWYHGSNQTFAIGGGGANVSGKKLHVDGGMTVGSSYDATAAPSNGLNVEGAIQQASNQVVHAGNVSSYALPIGGGTVTGRSVFAVTNAGTSYTNMQLETYTSGTGVAGISFHRGGYTAVALYHDGTGLKLDGNLLLTAANYTSYAMQGAGYSANQNLNTNSSVLFSTAEIGNSGLGGNAKLSSNSDGHAIYAQHTGGTSGAYTVIRAIRSASTGNAIDFYYSNSEAGYVQITSSTTVSYATSSDYRLKKNVRDFTGALSKIMRIKARRFQWINDDQEAVGFIAHELQEVAPEAVTGEKDAVKAEDGTPRYQGVDPSKLVVTLVAAIQEQQAQIDALKAEIALLKLN